MGFVLLVRRIPACRCLNGGGFSRRLASRDQHDGPTRYGQGMGKDDNEERPTKCGHDRSGRRQPGSDAGNNSFSISLDVTKPDLHLGAELLSDILLHATMPEKAVAREKEVQLAGIRDDEEQLTTVARNILRAALFGEHPYALRAKGTPEAVVQLTQKDLLVFRDRYLVAENGVISVFGNVKVAEVQELFEQMLAGMDRGELALTHAPPAPVLAQTVAVEELKEKAQGVLMVGYRGADMFSPDRYALELIDEAAVIWVRVFLSHPEEWLAY